MLPNEHCTSLPLHRQTLLQFDMLATLATSRSSLIGLENGNQRLLASELLTSGSESRVRMGTKSSTSITPHLEFQHLSQVGANCEHQPSVHLSCCLFNCDKSLNCRVVGATCHLPHLYKLDWSEFTLFSHSGTRESSVRHPC